MDVGPVQVSMCYRFVGVGMIVFANQFPIPVRVPVVLVVLVRMGMGELFVPVQMPMPFTIKKEHARKHDQRCHPVLAGRALTKDQNGKDGADERSRCEPGAGSCRSDLPQGIDAKDQTRSLAECADGERSHDLQCSDLAFEEDDGEQYVENPGAPPLHAGQEGSREGIDFPCQVVVDPPEEAGRDHAESG